MTTRSNTLFLIGMSSGSISIFNIQDGYIKVVFHGTFQSFFNIARRIKPTMIFTFIRQFQYEIQPIGDNGKW